MRTLSKKDIGILEEMFHNRKFWIKDSGFVIEIQFKDKDALLNKTRVDILHKLNYGYQSYFRVNNYKTQYIIYKHPPKSLIRKFIYRILTFLAESLINLRCKL